MNKSKLSFKKTKNIFCFNKFINFLINFFEYLIGLLKFSKFFNEKLKWFNFKTVKIDWNRIDFK